jgi:methylase of polypeptide subunit release factors
MTSVYVIQGKEIVYDFGRAFPPSHATQDLANHMRIAVGDTVCDVCCGGGLLSIAASLLGASRVFATDIDAASLRTAMTNGTKNGVSNIEYLLGDCLEQVSELVDVVVANPPQLPSFIANRSRKPAQGWIEGGGDGTEFVIRLIKESHAQLKPRGRLYLPVFSLANPTKTKEVFNRYFSCSRVNSRTVRVDERHGLDQLEYMWELGKTGTVELALVDGFPSWTIEVYEGVKRLQPLS